MNTQLGNPECHGDPLYYSASQTVGDDELVRLCTYHAEERGYGTEEYAGSAAANAVCDESGLAMQPVSALPTIENNAENRCLLTHSQDCECA